MSIPPEYAPWFESLGFTEIEFGYGGIKLFAPDELDEAQNGYSRTAEGCSLCNGASGAWKPEWTVIGYDTLLGDPIILDTTNSRVMTAMHGEGIWEPYAIAKSLHSFAAELDAVRQVSAGRESPVALEQNPISAQERERVLQLILNANEGEINLEFWELLLESGLP